MSLTRSAIWFWCTVALGLSGCTSESGRDFGGGDPSAYVEDDVPTPPPYENIVYGEVGGFSVGQIESAYLVRVTLSCGAKFYMLWLSDYPFRCSDVLNALKYGSGLVTDDPDAVFSYLTVSLYAYNAALGGFEGNATVGDYTVLNGDKELPVLDDGSLVALPLVAFGDMLGTVSEAYLPNSGDLAVDFVHRPEFFAGTFQADFGSDGILEGEFNVSQCD